MHLRRREMVAGGPPATRAALPSWPLQGSSYRPAARFAAPSGPGSVSAPAMATAAVATAALAAEAARRSRDSPAIQRLCGEQVPMLHKTIFDVLKRRQLSRLVRVGRARARARGYASGRLHGHRRQGVAPGRQQHASGAGEGRCPHRARPRGCRTSRRAWHRSRVGLQLWGGLPRRLVRGLPRTLPRTGRAGVAQRRRLGRRIVPQVLLQPSM